MEYEKVSKSRKGQIFDLHYDKLVIGVGAYSQTFKTPGVREHAHFLKDVGDARKIRKRLLECFETAALPTTPDSIRKQILHFAIVGGGPTGVEFSAELYDLIHEDLVKIYPELLPHVKISLYDVSPKVLTMFDDQLAKYAMDTFSRSGIDIRTSKQISSLSPGLPETAESLGHAAGRLGVTLSVRGQEPQGVGMCIWSTGLMANPFIAKALSTIRQFPPKEVIFKDHYPQAESAQWSIARDEKTGRIVTNDRLRVVIDAPLSNNVKPLPTAVDPTKMSARLRDVFALGDCAFIYHTDYPATAQVANQKAEWLAKRLNAGDLDKPEVDKFRYKSLGIMAYLGNARAIVGGLGGMRNHRNKEVNLSGRAAWFVWRGAYLVRSISWRNRVLIPVYWVLNWAFGRDISRF